MKKRLKKYAIVTVAMLFGMIVGACGLDNIKAEQTNPIKIWFENENGKMETYCVVDEDTGVNYIVISGELYQKSVGAAITPRLNADGSLYTSK